MEKLEIVGFWIMTAVMMLQPILRGVDAASSALAERAARTENETAAGVASTMDKVAEWGLRIAGYVLALVPIIRLPKGPMGGSERKIP